MAPNQFQPFFDELDRLDRLKDERNQAQQFSQLGNIIRGGALGDVGGVQGINTIAGQSFADESPGSVGTFGSGSLGDNAAPVAAANRDISMADILSSGGSPTPLQSGIADLFIQQQFEDPSVGNLRRSRIELNKARTEAVRNPAAKEGKPGKTNIENTRARNRMIVEAMKAWTFSNEEFGPDDPRTLEARRAFNALGGERFLQDTEAAPNKITSKGNKFKDVRAKILNLQSQGIKPQDIANQIDAEGLTNDEVNILKSHLGIKGN